MFSKHLPTKLKAAFKLAVQVKFDECKLSNKGQGVKASLAFYNPVVEITMQLLRSSYLFIHHRLNFHRPTPQHILLPLHVHLLHPHPQKLSHL